MAAGDVCPNGGMKVSALLSRRRTRLVTCQVDNAFGSVTGTVGDDTFGDDTSVFSPDNGNDVIHDFHQGEDTIELNGLARFLPEGVLDRVPEEVLNRLLEKFMDVLDRLPDQVFIRLLEKFTGISIETVDANEDGSLDSVIHFDGSNSATVLNVAHLSGSDFDFVV
jgi:hypothetical protein